MRPRGRGDDVEDDDDDEFEDVSPLRSTPEPEAEAEPEPEAADPEPFPAPPQPARPPLSSLVVRPPPQENGGSSPSPSAGRPARSPSPADNGGPRRGSPPPRRRREFSPPGPRGWDRRRSPPPPERRRPVSPPPPRRRYSPPRFQPPRHPRYHDELQGHGMHSGPSPPRPRRLEASTFDDAVGPRYPRGYPGGGRGGRFREASPPYGREGRSYGRGYPGKDFINIDGEYVHRNDPNLSPREGDWICQNPICGNLNFARRTHCNNCNKYRYAPEAYEPGRSPRRGYLSPPRGPARGFGPPVERAPPREMARYRSPPRDWGVGDPRGYASRSPPADRAGRFAEPSFKERMAFRGNREPRDRAKFDWSATDNYNQRERPHDGMYHDRSRRRSVSPRGHWGSDLRDRSRSPRNRPMKSSFPGRGPPDDYADPYMSRGRPTSLEAGRGRGRGRGYRPGGGPYPGEGRGDRRAAPRARNDDGY
ncbi:hypothetical protein EJB05_42433, partial [Eragrostis curvula]